MVILSCRCVVSVVACGAVVVAVVAAVAAVAPVPAAVYGNSPIITTKIKSYDYAASWNTTHYHYHNFSFVAAPIIKQNKTAVN